MSDGYTVVALGELGLEMAGNVRWHTIRSTLGIQAFGINAWTATADGQQVIGDHDEAGEGATGHEEVYNLACAEARAGKTEEALEHVAAAVALESRFGEIAPTDDDLASIRDDPRFPSG